MRFSAKRLLIVVGASLLGGTLWHYATAPPEIRYPRPDGNTYIRDESGWVCSVCGTGKHETSFGPDAKRAAKTTLNPSLAHTDLLDGQHTHDWSFISTSSYYGPLQSDLESIGCGAPQWPGATTSRYNEDQEYRESVQSRIAAGTLDKDEFIRTLLTERSNYPK